MANEITAQAGLILANGNLAAIAPFQSLSLTQTTPGAYSATVSVGSGAEQDISLTGPATPGWLFIRNLDGTNFIKFGPKSGGVMVEFGRLKAKEFALFRIGPSGVTLRAIADTAACNLFYMYFAD